MSKYIKRLRKLALRRIWWPLQMRWPRLFGNVRVIIEWQGVILSDGTRRPFTEKDKATGLLNLMSENNDRIIFDKPGTYEVSGTIEFPSNPPDKLANMRIAAQWFDEVQYDAERQGDHIELTAVYPDGTVQRQIITMDTIFTLTIADVERRVKVTRMDDEGTGFSVEVLE